MELESFIGAIADRIIEYLHASDEPGKVSNPVPHTSLAKTSDLKLPLEGNGMDAVLDDIDAYLLSCVKTNRPEFMNPLWGGINTAALAGEIISTLTNTSMYTYELAPLATLIEQTLVQRMGELVGFLDGAGTLTTGGSNGNMLGMLCARQVMVPTSTQTGIDGRSLVAYVSSEAHYSVLMAANVIGIGHQNVIKVACDSNGCMQPEALQDEINRPGVKGVHRSASFQLQGQPFAVRSIRFVKLAMLHIRRGFGTTLMQHGVVAHNFQLSTDLLWMASNSQTVYVGMLTR
jgi:glutamate/tyrosine decarboxylase-like PLP-dependent enzyme